MTKILQLRLRREVFGFEILYVASCKKKTFIKEYNQKLLLKTTENMVKK
jgi:hypothetical protein